ncbi:uncharacterized protein [Elaeis guineensis]|uniref:Uncharacterized protein LOC105055108 n=1 Tax=Elaeis guineensis var. tenera TaxID=51953 RepID=A0A6I9RZJ0_ELAGV|nr:uncharacterized protein LOC105055108 [Elaeis guineensis]
MDPVASVLDRIKGFVKSTEQFVKGAIQRRFDFHRHDPIGILKRLQREAFSDLMKLRDRQDKVERMLSLHKSGKGSLFPEASTRMKGIIDVAGALMLRDDQQTCDTLDRAGINSGIDSRFIFETTVRQKDSLVAEFMSSSNDIYYDNDVAGSPLVLAKVMYLAHINELLSVISIPFGAKCNDFRSDMNLAEGRSLSGFTSSSPPLFSQRHGCAAGLTVKASNITASLAEMISCLGTEPDAADYRSILSTFWQISYQLSEETKLTLSGAWKMPSSLSQPIRLGNVAVPKVNLRSHFRPHVMAQASPSATTMSTIGIISGGSAAITFEFDESTKFGGWVEVQKSNPSPSLLQWAITLSDTPDDEVGWGVSVGGRVEGQSNLVRLEGFLNFSMGERGSLQPGLVCVMDGTSRTPALVFRSSWFM